jgi:hypothetical protein
VRVRVRLLVKDIRAVAIQMARAGPVPSLAAGCTRITSKPALGSRGYRAAAQNDCSDASEVVTDQTGTRCAFDRAGI